MFRRLSRLCVVVMLTLAVGGHWVILQSVAWFTMVAAYSQEAPITEALSKTFDGKHPCQLCHVVAEGKKSEKQQEQKQLVVKLDLFMQASLLQFHAPAFEPVLSPGARCAPARHEAPALPPPIAA